MKPKKKSAHRNKSSLCLPPPPSPLGKVCTVSYLSTPRDYYAVVIVDLESSSSSSSSPLDGEGGGGGSYISTAPTFLLERIHLNNDFHVFCVLGSILYIFPIGNPTEFLPPKGCSVYSVDLDHTKSKSENLVLDKSMIRKSHDLVGAKYATEAIPTPDGKKILVFSIVIYYASPDLIQFELYDPFNKEGGKSLPSPEVSLHHYFSYYNGFRNNKYSIESFAFIRDSVFLIQTNECGIFTINIDVEHPSWQKMDSFAGSIHIPFDHRFYMLEDHKLYIDGRQAYTCIHKNDKVFDCRESSEFPRSSISCDLKQGSLCFNQSHILYGKDGKLFGSVRFQTGISKYHPNLAYMRVDVYKFDLAKFQKDIKKLGKGALLESSIHKTFKFVLDVYPRCFHFRAKCCYPIVT